ncbi:hypothetical protein, partial [Paraburkholderia sabiae]|uniref:hypothetical protein n=1 Tax=Paraburkholderia sabiae TaxID=273251 RepID=UPI001F2DACF5
PIYTCLALIPAGSSAIRLPRPSTLVQRILNGSHATLTTDPSGDADHRAFSWRRYSYRARSSKNFYNNSI